MPSLQDDVILLCYVISDEELKDDLAGSTANIVLIKDNKIYCVSCNHLLCS